MALAFCFINKQIIPYIGRGILLGNEGFERHNFFIKLVKPREFVGGHVIANSKGEY